jgi:hypothetical protein
MLKSLKEHPKPIRVIAYITYAICVIGIIASLSTNNPFFLLLSALPIFLTALGDFFYQIWFVQKYNQQNTSLNVKYLVFFGLSCLVFIYPGTVKKYWTNVNKKHTKPEHPSRS